MVPYQVQPCRRRNTLQTQEIQSSIANDILPASNQAIQTVAQENTIRDNFYDEARNDPLFAKSFRQIGAIRDVQYKRILKVSEK